MGFFDSIKSFFGGVVDELRSIPQGASVIVSGTEHVISDGYGALKSVVSDVYGSAKTATNDTIDILGKAEKQTLSPFTDTINTFSYPIIFIGGALGFYIIYEMSQTSRAALPYASSIIESGAKVAPLFGAF